MMIKAIETVYKGYRFRSRTEARWAVFFDKLGIQWEYEKEGYDLGEAGWYLPDFWLPDFGTWVEIKPDNADIKTASLKVFCAGKVGEHNHNADWRYSLLKDGDFFLKDQREYLQNPASAVLDMIANCKYVGPFSYDGCGGHGSGNARIMESHGEEHPERVVMDCQNRIRSCDVVFAWIDSEDCFGTLVELGYAAALGKEIWIGCPPASVNNYVEEDAVYGYRDNLWYAFATAKKVRVAATPKEAFLTLHQELFSVDQRKCMALARQARKDVFLLRGAPWPGEHSFWGFSCNSGVGVQNFGEFNHGTAFVLGKFGDLDVAKTKVKSAFNAARSARFEHGESGA